MKWHCKNIIDVHEQNLRYFFPEILILQRYEIDLQKYTSLKQSESLNKYTNIPRKSLLYYDKRIWQNSLDSFLEEFSHYFVIVKDAFRQIQNVSSGYNSTVWK